MTGFGCKTPCGFRNAKKCVTCSCESVQSFGSARSPLLVGHVQGLGAERWGRGQSPCSPKAHRLSGTQSHGWIISASFVDGWFCSVTDCFLSTYCVPGSIRGTADPVGNNTTHRADPFHGPKRSPAAAALKCCCAGKGTRRSSPCQAPLVSVRPGTLHFHKHPGRSRGTSSGT